MCASLVVVKLFFPLSRAVSQDLQIMSSPSTACAESSKDSASPRLAVTPTSQVAAPLPARGERNTVRCHVALGLSQVIFAASMTIVRSAFIESEEVSPIIIVGGRLFLSMLVFTTIHFIRLHRRRSQLAAARGAAAFDATICSDGDASPTLETSSSVECDADSKRGDVVKHVSTGAIEHADEFQGLSTSLKLRCVLLGGIGITVNLLGSASGVKYANAVTAGALQCATPPITCVIAYLFCNDTLPTVKIIGLVLAIVGNMVMVRVWCLLHPAAFASCADAASSVSPTYYLGCLFLVVNVTVYSSYLVFQRPVVKLLPNSEFLFRGCLYGFMSILLIALCRFDLVWGQLTNPNVMTREVMVAIGFAGIVNSGLAYYLVSVGISGVPPSIAAIYFCSQPVLTTTFSTVFLGEGVTLMQAGGGVLVISGLLVSAVYRAPRLDDHQNNEGNVDQGNACATMPTTELTIIIPMKAESPRHDHGYLSLETASPTT